MWDESLYAVRAKSVYLFGDWIDQTPHSVGGLYSSSHPPLFIWLTALAYKFFGISEFTTRFFSAFFGALTVIFVFLIAKKFFEIKVALFSASFLGSVYLFTYYSRLGQLDIPYIFFVTASLYPLMLYIQNRKTLNLFISGILIGFSLMTKLFVGSTAPISIAFFLMLQVLRKEKNIKQAFVEILIPSSIGLIIALPWHIYMMKVHGQSFIKTIFQFHIIERITQGVEGNIPELGYLYFLNQLIVQLPLAILILFDAFETVKNFKVSSPAKVFLHLWFWATFLIFTVSKTKIPTYLLPSLVPAVLISARYFVEILKREKNIVQLFSLAVAIIWSSSQEVRNAVKDLLKFNFTPEATKLTVLFVLSSVVSLFLIWLAIRKLNREKFQSLGLFIAISVCLVVSVKSVFFEDYARFVDGAETTGNFIDNSPNETLLYLHTEHSTAGMNPQITFYSLRKIKNQIRWIEIPRGDIERINAEIRLNANPLVLIERTAKDKKEKREELNRAVHLLENAGFKKKIEVKRYFLFEKSTAVYSKSNHK